MANELKNTNAAKGLSELYLDDELADFYFMFQGEKVPVHKIILAKSSKVFHAQFYGGVKDKDSVEIIHSNIHAFKVFLQFFYLDKVTLTMEHIEEVVKLADYYDMWDCVYDCVEFLMGQLTDQNVIWCYQLASLLGNHTLIQSCEDRIIHNTKNVMKSDGFHRCHQKILENILKMEVVACDESKLFEACILWAKHAAQQNGMDENNAENLRKQLGDCFYFIRFAAMKTDEFATSTKDYKDLFTRDEWEGIVCATTDAMKTTIFSQVPRISIDLSKWSDSPKLSCQRTFWDYDVSYKVSLKLRFSVNVPALLGGINYMPIPIDRIFGVKILEIDDHSHSPNETPDETPDENVIFARTFVAKEDELTKIPLSNALIIHPQKIYEIRLKIDEGFGGYIYSGYDLFEAEYELDEQLVVKILSGRDSLIEELFFKRL